VDVHRHASLGGGEFGFIPRKYFPYGKPSRWQFDRRMVGPYSWSSLVTKRYISVPPGIEPNNPTHDQSPYLLLYPEYKIYTIYYDILMDLLREFIGSVSVNTPITQK
jgi:hypothetical protein